MSSGDFETEVRQSVADHVALIQTAATAAKGRIVTSVDAMRSPSESVAAAVDFGENSAGLPPRPAVDFSAQEPAFVEEPAFDSQLPDGAIAFDDLAVESVDDGVPVWEDAP